MVGPAREMPESRRGPRVLAGLVAAAIACLAAAAPAPEEKGFVRSPSPVVPQPEKGRALVYLLRPIWVLGTLPPLPLLDERQIFGYLPVRGYLAVQLEPGERAIPAPVYDDAKGVARGEGLELFLVAGRTHVLRLDEKRDEAGRLQGRWAEMSLADLPAYVAAKKLKFVTLTDEGRAALEKARADRVAAAPASSGR